MAEKLLQGLQTQTQWYTHIQAKRLREGLIELRFYVLHETK